VRNQQAILDLKLELIALAEHAQAIERECSMPGFYRFWFGRQTPADQQLISRYMDIKKRKARELHDGLEGGAR